MVTRDVKEMQGTAIQTPSGHYCELKGGQLMSELELRNAVEQLVANIARLKDHLKEWCEQNGATFEGERLINANNAVAIIHDLWNTDKHAKLHRPPRSGHYPRLVNLGTSLSLTAGPNVGGKLVLKMDEFTGKVTTTSSAGGSADIAIVGTIEDENGVLLGTFQEICSEAIAQWETVLIRAGVQIPKC